jgi:hypothetical protein
MNPQQIYNALMNIATKNDETGVYTVNHEDISKLMTPKPKRGLTALRAYMKDNKDAIKSKNPDGCKVQGGFLKMASQEYHNLDDSAKAEYILIAEKDTERYKREIAEYHMIFTDKTKTKTKVKGKRGRPTLDPEEKKERAKKKKKKNAKVSNDSDDSDTEEISIIHVDGKDYYLDNNTDTIYDINGKDIVGKKTDAGYTFN